MKSLKYLPVLCAAVVLSACGDSGSSGGDTESSSGLSKSEAISLCRSSVERAVRAAGSDERDMMRAGDKAMEDCMAGYGYSPK